MHLCLIELFTAFCLPDNLVSRQNAVYLAVLADKQRVSCLTLQCGGQGCFIVGEEI